MTGTHSYTCLHLYERITRTHILFLFCERAPRVWTRVWRSLTPVTRTTDIDAHCVSALHAALPSGTDVLVGFVTFCDNNILHLYVHPRFRGRRFSHALLQLFFEHTHSLQVVVRSGRAPRFWSHLGFAAGDYTFTHARFVDVVKILRAPHAYCVSHTARADVADASFVGLLHANFYAYI